MAGCVPRCSTGCGHATITVSLFCELTTLISSEIWMKRSGRFWMRFAGWGWTGTKVRKLAVRTVRIFSRSGDHLYDAALARSCWSPEKPIVTLNCQPTLRLNEKRRRKEEGLHQQSRVAGIVEGRGGKESRRRSNFCRTIARSRDETRVVINDHIRGTVEFDCSLMPDPVIARNDGSPLYNFATVVDDAELEITHVIRAEEHLSNTPIQVLLHRRWETGRPNGLTCLTWLPRAAKRK